LKTKRKLSYAQVEKILRGVLTEYFGSSDQKEWGDLNFWTPKAWKDKGEEYGLDGLAVMTFEGAVYPLLNYGEDGWKFHTMLNERLKAKGLWFEMGYAWSLAVYEL
jgi:hypothetical protein